MRAVDDLRVRAPLAVDGKRIWSLVRSEGVLEDNSAYGYLLLCTHFAAHGLVAERSGELAGFVTAYRPPDDPEALFVWQIGVAANARGCGLGRTMLVDLIRRPANRDARYLSATVAPGNGPSNRLFAAFARVENVRLETREGYAAELFPSAHEPEPMLRIGPLAARA
ncbi:MAG TPA: diaminobutyrate acetyltransferase [Gammaproteobacteria bacterium]|nr:diaminobutyrate acetyltransferase [Gammaproteobacteria bacterium]